MDGQTPSSLFQDTANLKSIKPDLSVFVAVGGWYVLNSVYDGAIKFPHRNPRTFSDNGTATQPLFGEIAADASKRQIFANNVVHFMKQYGMSSDLLNVRKGRGFISLFCQLLLNPELT